MCRHYLRGLCMKGHKEMGENVLEKQVTSAITCTSSIRIACLSA